ncbi:MAG TPA: bacterioferritin [Acidobacteriota bacterium]|nr:bacterioferritin [Acidobacteriota bacterium]
MKGNAEVIELLNEALSDELTAINQYFLHAEMCENWGYKKQSAASKKQAIDEMKHAEVLIERILFLDAKPNLSKYQKLTIGQTVPDMIANDLSLELAAVVKYNKIIDVATQKNDQGTAELLKKILKDEEAHVDTLEEMQDNIRDMGVQIFLSVQK